MRVLVTGGAGFIGSELVRQLLADGHAVTVLDNFVTGDMANLQDVVSRVGGEGDAVSDHLDLISGDIRRVDLVELLKAQDISRVFHLAAEPYIPSCYDRPEEFFSVNANGTLRLLLACKEAGVDRVLTYSSSEVYGTAQEVPMDETHRTAPHSTYAVSKLAADRLCATLYHEQGVPVVVLRQFNCYGPRETHPYIVPELIAQLSEGSTVSLGNTGASRDLTFVADAVRGAVALMDCPEAEGEVVNLGYGDDVTVEELAHMVGEEMGHDDISIEVEQERFRPNDVQRLVCDYTKAEELVDYAPTVPLREGLRRTIDWYRGTEGWIWEKTMKDGLWA